MLTLFLLIACTPQPELSVTLRVVDEDGALVDDAELALPGDTLVADGGRIRIQDVIGPVSGVISAPGHLNEPVIVGRGDASRTRTVRLWSDDKWAVHAGGDVMFGRRFTDEDGWLAEDEAAGAQTVVEHLAPLFAAADVSMVNVETVLGELDPSDSYPGKRYVLGSPSASVAGLEAMGIDVGILANNHIRDWLDPGIISTRDILQEHGIADVGASDTDVDADDPVVLQVGDTTVGVLAYTTLNGSYVNDAYPGANASPPASPSDDTAWQYEERQWSFRGDTWRVPEAARRIGPAWDLFRAAEADLSDGERAAAFASLRSVYPEIQDWVARRGHGGAARWHAESVEQITSLAEQVDVVIVNLHGGYDLAAAPSGALRDAARDAAEAGAHLVIGHHPHVLHGAEWLGDALIVHSLGNLVFDQESLPTRGSAMLRTVWDGSTLMEARLLPLELVDYRPIPVADVAAERTVRHIAEVSLAQQTARVGTEGIETSTTETGTVPASVRLQDHTAVLTRDPTQAETLPVSVRAGRIADLPWGLIGPRLNTDDPNLLVGRDLLGWGHYEDVLADGLHDPGAHWLVNSEWETILPVRRTDDGRQVLHLQRDVFNEGTVTTQLDAQVPLVPHRQWGTDTALDPTASYAIRFRARQTGTGQASLRLQGFTYDRGTLAVDPSTEEAYDVDIPLDLGSGWQEVVIDVDPTWLDEDVNRLRPSFRLAPPERGSTELFVDAVQVLELRQANQMPQGWGAWDVVRNTGDVRADVRVSVR